MNAAHLHLLVNHVPIVGFALGFVLLIGAMIWRGDRGMFAASVIVLVIAGSGALAAQFSGEPAEEVVEHLQDVHKASIERHESLALVATILAGITTVCSVGVAVVTLRRSAGVPLLPLSLLALATLITFAVMAWTGTTGGRIRHSEIRGAANSEVIFSALAIHGDVESVRGSVRGESPGASSESLLKKRNKPCLSS